VLCLPASQGLSNPLGSKQNEPARLSKCPELFSSEEYRVIVFRARLAASSLMTQQDHEEGTSGKVILFIVLGVFPVIFMLIVLLFGPMLGLRFGA